MPKKYHQSRVAPSTTDLSDSNIVQFEPQHELLPQQELFENDQELPSSSSEPLVTTPPFVPSPPRATPYTHEELSELPPDFYGKYYNCYTPLDHQYSDFLDEYITHCLASDPAGTNTPSTTLFSCTYHLPFFPTQPSAPQNSACCRAYHIDQLRNLALRGFLNSYHRRRAWPLLLGLDAESIDLNYTRHIDPTHSMYNQLNKDIARSCTHLDVHTTNSDTTISNNRLYTARILHSLFAKFDGTISYCQGFHDIVVVMMVICGVTPPEERINVALEEFYGDDNILPQHQDSSSTRSEALSTAISSQSSNFYQARISHTSKSSKSAVHATTTPHSLIKTTLKNVAAQSNDALAFALVETLAMTSMREALRGTLENVMALAEVIPSVLLPFNEHFASMIANLPLIYSLSWFITWFSHTTLSINVISRMFDFLLSSSPLMCIHISSSILLAHAKGIRDELDRQYAEHRETMGITDEENTPEQYADFQRDLGLVIIANYFQHVNPIKDIDALLHLATTLWSLSSGSLPHIERGVSQRTSLCGGASVINKPISPLYSKKFDFSIINIVKLPLLLLNWFRTPIKTDISALSTILTKLSTLRVNTNMVNNFIMYQSGSITELDQPSEDYDKSGKKMTVLQSITQYLALNATLSSKLVQLCDELTTSYPDRQIAPLEQAKRTTSFLPLFTSLSEQSSTLLITNPYIYHLFDPNILATVPKVKKNEDNVLAKQQPDLLSIEIWGNPNGTPDQSLGSCAVTLPHNTIFSNLQPIMTSKQGKTAPIYHSPSILNYVPLQYIMACPKTIKTNDIYHQRDLLFSVFGCDSFRQAHQTHAANIQHNITPQLPQSTPISIKSSQKSGKKKNLSKQSPPSITHSRKSPEQDITQNIIATKLDPSDPFCIHTINTNILKNTDTQLSLLERIYQQHAIERHEILQTTLPPPFITPHQQEQSLNFPIAQDGNTNYIGKSLNLAQKCGILEATNTTAPLFTTIAQASTNSNPFMTPFLPTLFSYFIHIQRLSHQHSCTCSHHESMLRTCVSLITYRKTIISQLIAGATASKLFATLYSGLKYFFPICAEKQHWWQALYRTMLMDIQTLAPPLKTSHNEVPITAPRLAMRYPLSASALWTPTESHLAYLQQFNADTAVSTAFFPVNEKIIIENQANEITSPLVSELATVNLSKLTKKQQQNKTGHTTKPTAPEEYPTPNPANNHNMKDNYNKENKQTPVKFIHPHAQCACDSSAFSNTGYFIVPNEDIVVDDVLISNEPTYASVVTNALSTIMPANALWYLGLGLSIVVGSVYYRR